MELQGTSNNFLLSPQLDEPVQDEKNEATEEQHVAQEFGLAASGELLDSADGGAEQTPRRVKVRVLVWERGIGSSKSCSHCCVVQGAETHMLGSDIC